MTTPLHHIPHSRPALGEEEVQALAAVVRSGQLAQGPQVERFEQGLAAFIGLQGGVAVNSGAAALELALLALGIGSGDEVILPSYVCTAPWLAVARVGALARIVDIDPDTYAIDPVEVEQAITARTRAIIVPHPFGMPADLTRLQALGVPLIEDCAQALGASEAGRPVGSVGAVTVCSFYATKLLCTGEGGMVLSNNPALLDRVRALREYDEAPALNPTAFNRKMTELQAALGTAQLAKLPAFLERRVALAAFYHEQLAKTDLELPRTVGSRSHIYFRYVVRVRRRAQRHDTVEALMARLARRGVQCRRPVFCPLHRYLGLHGYPASEEAYQTALSIPIYPALADDEAARVGQVLCEELAYGETA